MTLLVDIAGVPIANGLIKCTGINKHLPHISDSAGVPIAKEFVKSVAPCKYATHICDILRVPKRNVPIALYTGRWVLKPQFNALAELVVVSKCWLQVLANAIQDIAT
jgi:hypothetical protein